MNVQQLKRRPALLCGQTPPSTTEPYTVVIFGVPRGGTTMVAGVVQRCGIFLGDDLPANLEDPAFAGPPVPPIPRMLKMIAERNKAHEVWGWKYPRAADYLPRLAGKLRNPRLITVWRDAVATAGRRIAHGSTVENALKSVMMMQQRNIRLFKQLDCPKLVVSYERAVLEPVPFVETIAEFLAMPMPSNMDEMLQFMTPGTYKSPEIREER